MLQAIRSKAGSLVVKILFGLLILSFAVWGIGDIFRTKGTETTVATIGSKKISAEQLQTAVRREMERLRAQFGGAVDLEQMKQLGLFDGVLDQLVTRDLIDLESDRLGLVVADDVVRRAITGNPAFRSAGGTFDRTIYNRVLVSNRMSEVQYESQLRRDLIRTQLVDAVTVGAAAPGPAVEALFRMRNEKRVADTLFLGPTAVSGLPEPTDADLAQYYEAHAESFRAPEYRGFTIVAIRPEDLAAEIPVTEDRLKDDYKTRVDEFSTPEKRTVEQIVVGDEAKAKEVQAELAAGKDFLEVAKSLAGMDADGVKLGTFTRGESELPKALVDAAFDVKEGTATPPVQSPLGYHVMRVTAIEPAIVPTFEAIRDRLADDARRETAIDRVFKLANEMEDALAAGSSIEEAAAKFKMKAEKIASTDLNGRDAGDAEIALPIPAADVLKIVFGTPQGQASRLTETRDGAYFVVRTDSVVASALRPLADVKPRTASLWLEEKRNAALEAKAKEIVAAIVGGKTFEEVATANGLIVATTAPFTRSGSTEAKLPGAVVSRIFAAQPNETISAAASGGVFVAQVKSIDRPETITTDPGLAQLSRQIEGAMRSDLLASFELALRTRYPVEIRRDEIARFF